MVESIGSCMTNGGISQCKLSIHIEKKIYSVKQQQVFTLFGTYLCLSVTNTGGYMEEQKQL